MGPQWIPRQAKRHSSSNESGTFLKVSSRHLKPHFNAPTKLLSPYLRLRPVTLQRKTHFSHLYLHLPVCSFSHYPNLLTIVLGRKADRLVNQKLPQGYPRYLNFTYGRGSPLTRRRQTTLMMMMIVKKKAESTVTQFQWVFFWQSFNSPPPVGRDQIISAARTLVFAGGLKVAWRCRPDNAISPSAAFVFVFF